MSTRLTPREEIKVGLKNNWGKVYTHVNIYKGSKEIYRGVCQHYMI